MNKLHVIIISVVVAIIAGAVVFIPFNKLKGAEYRVLEQEGDGYVTGYSFRVVDGQVWSSHTFGGPLNIDPVFPEQGIYLSHWLHEDKHCRLVGSFHVYHSLWSIWTRPDWNDVMSKR